MLTVEGTEVEDDAFHGQHLKPYVLWFLSAFHELDFCSDICFK